MSKIIGIDLGTTNSVVAILEGNEPSIIVNAEGGRLTPSVVAFTGEERLVGQIARNQAVTNPTNTVFSIKRFMGRRHNEVASEEKLVSYKIVGGPNELVKVEAGGKVYTPPEISAMILQSLKRSAEDYLGEKVTQAVITVPAYFNDSQRQATKEAGEIAGLEVKRIINEPTAAALAYGLGGKAGDAEKKIAVFDFGGGTFDISILEVAEGVFQVLSTNGDTHLGGDDFDKRVIDYLADEFKKEHRIDLRKDQMALQRLKEAAEKAKCELSSSMQATVNLPFITADQSGPKHLMITLSRATLESLLEPLIERSRKPCEKALADAGLKPEQIDEIVLVGGSTRVPAVQAIVRNIFKKLPDKSMNVDEVVAAGAAIQAGILGGTMGKDIVLIDVTPLSLGIETKGGIMTVLIERNQILPASKKEVFSTAEDNQEAVDIKVYQGEREFVSDNRILDQFRLAGIPPAPMGIPKIEVSFDIDANGILHVSAKDLGTGKEKSIEIQSSSGLSKDEIERMKREAKENANKDKERRALIEAKNAAEGMMHRADKALKDAGDKANAEVKTGVEKAIADVKSAVEGEDIKKITAATESLANTLHALSQALYQTAQKPEAGGASEGPAPEGSDAGDDGGDGDGGGGGGDSGKGGKDDDIIDAEFEEVN